MRAGNIHRLRLHQAGCIQHIPPRYEPHPQIRLAKGLQRLPLAHSLFYGECPAEHLIPPKVAGKAIRGGVPFKQQF